MKVPFVGGAYEGRSTSVNAERTLNFFLEKQNEKWILVGTPGLTLRLTLDYGPVRCLYQYGDVMYAVAGSRVYSITSAHVATLLGTISTSSGRVSMADNGTDVLIVDGSTTGYYITVGALTAIADVDFIGATMVTSQDGYFIVSEPDSSRIRISDLYSATSWIDTDFATAEGFPDKLRAVISDHREVFLLGVKTTEIWYNSGDADFPFARVESGFIDKGIAAAHSVVKSANSILWLSEDDRGKGLVVSVGGGYKAVIISPIGINYKIAQYSTISDCFAFTYQIEGHEFSVFTFPTANATWVYDAVTEQWHQWSSNLDNNPLSRHRANCHAAAFGRHYVGDYNSGKIYTIEQAVYSENGTEIVRDRITTHIENGNEKLGINSVEILFEAGVGLSSGQGSDPQAMLRWSKDGGRTFGNELWRSVGAIGDYKARAVWRKIGGKPRSWTPWLRVSDPVKWIVQDMVIIPRNEGSKRDNG